MSFQVDTSVTITLIVNQMLERFKTEHLYSDQGTVREPGLYIPLELRVYNYDEDIIQSTYLHFLFCGNTSVWVQRTADHFSWVDQLNLQNFINTSNHDSCWQTAGVEYPLNDVYFELCKNIIKESKNTSIRPIDLSTNTFFALTPVQRVMIDHRQEDDGYNRTLVNVRQI